MLNKEQLLASEIRDDRVLVLAGPGTGKTTTLVARYKYLIAQGTKPEEIICCTFSRKASDEIKIRIEKETNLSVKGFPIGTFHSLAIRSLSKLSSTINIDIPKDVLSEKQRQDIIDDIKEDNKIKLDGLKFSEQLPSNILKYIDEIREKLIDPEDAAIEASLKGDEIQIAYADFYKLYEEFLNENTLVDFPRMIQFAYKAFAHDAANDKSYISQFKHILVDEYQDINFSQKTMIDELLKGGSSLWVVGDDDQAIYGWRGSNVKFILEFEDNYKNAKKVILNTNYRSENKIVIAANNLANNFVERHEKNIISFGNDEGEVSILKTEDETLEADKIVGLIKNKTEHLNYKDIAVLARTNTLPKLIVKALSSENIPMILKNNVNLFNESFTKDLLTAAAICSDIKADRGWNKKISPKLYGFAKKLSENHNWEKNLKSLSTFIINNLPSKLQDSELESKVEEIESCRNYLSSYDNSEKAFNVLKTLFNEPKDKNGVHIGTIHGAKGLEWDTVIVMGCEDDKLPHMMNEQIWQIEEERRIAYVAITRPKTNLYLTWAEKRDGFEKYPSPYLNEMLNKKVDVKIDKTSDKVSRYVSIMENFGREAREYKDKIEEAKKLEIQRDRQKRKSFIEQNRIAINSSIADGLGKTGEWKIKDTGNGFLLEVGYSAIKNGPSQSTRQNILEKVFYGEIDMPNTLKSQVAKMWGEPKSDNRLRKMRNTINTALGAQKAKTNASKQAIEKWENDLSYIDNVLKKAL